MPASASRKTISSQRIVVNSDKGDDARRQEARKARAVAICDGVIDVTAALFNVSSRELRETGRSSLPVSRVRQIAMYVTHVALGISMREVGVGFARDRTTVLHACHLVEDLRDDEEFDGIVALTERVVSAAFTGERGA